MSIKAVRGRHTSLMGKWASGRGVTPISNHRFRTQAYPRLTRVCSCRRWNLLCSMVIRVRGDTSENTRPMVMKNRGASRPRIGQPSFLPGKGLDDSTPLSAAQTLDLQLATVVVKNNDEDWQQCISSRWPMFTKHCSDMKSKYYIMFAVFGAGNTIKLGKEC